MPSSLPIADLHTAIQERLFPSITMWNRVEGRPRTQSFDRALQAEVRDALWMLTKQWQMGEFGGSDAGSPVFAKLQVDTTRLTKYRPGTGAAEPFDEQVPLEAKVERRHVPLRTHRRVASLDLRLAMGREWLTLTEGIGHKQAFVNAYPIEAPDPDSTADAEIVANPQAWELFAAVAGREMDGGKLYEHLVANPGNHAYDGLLGITPAERAAFDEGAKKFLAWFERLILQPPHAGDDAWAPSQLEYQFATSAPEGEEAEKVYVTDEYSQGRLDWYSLDVDPNAKPLGPVPGANVAPASVKGVTIPVPVSFTGMPNTRWWAFEERKMNYGDVDASTTDLAKLLFLEFALVFGNDWFVIPYTLPAGTRADVRGVAVTNVFGEHFWIGAAGAGADDDWQRWSMFTINVEGEAGAADTSLLLLPTVPKTDQGAPTEDVMLVRDEVANMVWGIETAVPLASGGTAPGGEAARQLREFYEAKAPAEEESSDKPTAPIRYQAMSTVPENWIPFIPAHVKGSNREIQLQRAALPRTLPGDPHPAKVEPRTVLLREGLESIPGEPYFLHEEEVSRAGTRVFQAYQRTRWTDGRVVIWLGARRQTGRGEGSSGLRFDGLVDQAEADS
ncbi:MAG: hypothetical protein ACTHK3_01840 [Solirubrobacterales bacterium]